MTIGGADPFEVKKVMVAGDHNVGLDGEGGGHDVSIVGVAGQDGAGPPGLEVLDPRGPESASA